MGPRCSSNGQRKGLPREACAKAQAKLAEAEVQQRKEEDDLEEGERRLDAFLQEADSTADFLPSGSPPTLPADLAAELAQLRASVQDLQRERDEFRVQLQCWSSARRLWTFRRHFSTVGER